MAANVPRPFLPNNELERVLLAARQGGLPVQSLVDALLRSQVFILIDKEIGPEGTWDASTSPLVISSSKGQASLAMFTSPARSADLAKQCPQFGFGLLVDFRWILSMMGPQLGLTVNPGWAAMMEMPPEGVNQLKADLHRG